MAKKGEARELMTLKCTVCNEITEKVRKHSGEERKTVFHSSLKEQLNIAKICS